MPKGTGGGGRTGRGGGGASNGDAGQPGEVVRAANQAREAERQPKPGDSRLTAMLRADYGGGNKGVNVSIEQLRGGTTKMWHANGSVSLNLETGVVVQTSGGKRYSYGVNKVTEGLTHWERLGGIK